MSPDGPILVKTLVSRFTSPCMKRDDSKYCHKRIMTTNGYLIRPNVIHECSISQAINRCLCGHSF